MNNPEVALTALERAERILSRRFPAVSPPAANPVEADSIKQAEAQVDCLGKSLGQGLMRTAARGYVAVALKGQKVADAVSSAWQQSLTEARREQEQKIAENQGPEAARQEAAEEKRGEKTLRSAFGDAEKVADTAAEAAEA